MIYGKIHSACFYAWAPKSTHIIQHIDWTHSYWKKRCINSAHPSFVSEIFMQWAFLSFFVILSSLKLTEAKAELILSERYVETCSSSDFKWRGCGTMFFWFRSRRLAKANHHLSLLTHRIHWSWLINTVYRKAVQQQEGRREIWIHSVKNMIALNNHSVRNYAVHSF